MLPQLLSHRTTTSMPPLLQLLLLLLPATKSNLVQGMTVHHPNFDINSTLIARNEYEYMKMRDKQLEEEKQFEGRDFHLSKEEQVVDAYLGFLKWKELLESKENGFLPSKPIEKVLDQIRESKVYQALVTMPKGGNLHLHEESELSKRTLFEIIWQSEDFEYLYMVHPDSNPDRAWHMDFFINPPTDQVWIKVKYSKYSMEDLLKRNTLIGVLTDDETNNPTDSKKRWIKITPLWTRAADGLTANIKIKKKYIEKTLEQFLSEGVTYLEVRKRFGLAMGLYELDYSGKSNKTFGKKFLDQDCNKEIELTKAITSNFIQKHPSFIDFKRISYTDRLQTHQSFKNHLNLAIKLHKKYPEHVIGFDVAAEEEQGHSTLYYLAQHLSQQADGYQMIPLYLHTTETSWPDDLLTGSFDDDLVPALQNAYESILLNSRRIGHGKGLIKKPYLLQKVKERKIAVEVCPTSNQILGMEPDLRNHYGQMLYKQGIPIVLSPDDPGTFGYDNLTIDWYSAYMSWGLNLGDLKQFAINSLTYSGMTKEEREVAINQKWLPSWEEYIRKTYREICRRNFTKEAIESNRKVTFIRSYPDAGRSDARIHIYGRNFERAICKNPKCKIGGKIVSAVYLSNQQLTCEVPGCSDCYGKMSIELDLDGLGWVQTNLTFKYFRVWVMSTALHVKPSMIILIITFLIALI